MGAPPLGPPLSMRDFFHSPTGDDQPFPIIESKYLLRIGPNAGQECALVYCIGKVSGVACVVLCIVTWY